MRVYLLNPPYTPHYIRSARSTWPSISGSNWYPIFLAYATGWLIKHKHTVKLVDALVAGMTKEQTISDAKEFKPDLLVIYVSPNSLENDCLYASEIKKQTGCQVVAVGPWCAYNPAGILETYSGVDMVVKREFDGAVLDIADNTKKQSIFGLVWRHGKEIRENPERPFLTARQLDDFPFVTRIYKQFLPIQKYYQASLLHPFVDLFTARGCVWGKCTFCLWPNTIQKGAFYRARSMESVAQELEFIKRELPQIREIFFQDDTLPAGRARQISEAIMARNMHMTWSCYARANVDFETLKLMKRAGCRFLHVGYESANQQILHTIRKGTTVADMERFTRDAKRAGLRIHGDFIIGLPGETEKTIRQTIAWAQKLGIEGYQFFVPEPEIGTPLYAWAKRKKFLRENGALSYPGLSQETMQEWRFRAMRSLYFDPRYIGKTLARSLHPVELARLVTTASHVIPNLVRSQ